MNSKDARNRSESYREGGKVERIKAYRKKAKPIEADARKAGHSRLASEDIASEVVDVLKGKKAPIGTKFPPNQEKDITDIIKKVAYHSKSKKKKK